VNEIRPAEGWRIGELARATRVTVRTLHHYDQLGLLVPSSRTSGGHRCYTADDVRCLHRIIALRSFGLSLEEIGRTLEQTADDPRDLVRRQLQENDERIRQAHSLRRRLLRVLGALDQLAEPSVTQFLELIGEMTAMNEPLTPEQIQRMAAERAEKMGALSAEEMADLSRKRAEAVGALSDKQAAEMRLHRSQAMPGLGETGN
jgi:DNA-binding transcriptional MerR regulator